MIEALLKRRIIRQFLKSYSEEQWKELIPDIFEIAILSLQRSFNKILFNKHELKDIIEDLHDTDYYKTIQPKKIDKLTKHKTDIDSRNSTLHQHSQTEIATKPVIMKQNQIYPSWWHDEQGNALRVEIENELKYQNSRKKTKSKQHFNQNYDYYKRTTKSKPKRIFEPKIYERMPTQSESNSVYSNYTCTESDYSYDKRLVLNKLTKSQHKNRYEPKSTITYKISYDKNLQPQSIEQKTKETKNMCHNGNTSSTKDKMQTTTLSSRNNGYQNETYPEKRTSSTKGDNIYTKEQSNQGSKYESRQHSHQHSHHTSQTHSLLQSQEIAPQTIPNQQQYMTRPQMPVQIQQTRQQIPHNIEHQHFHNQTNSYLTNQQAYTQTNETQTHQYMQSEPLYEEYYEPNNHMMNPQMNYKIVSHHEMEPLQIEQQSQSHSQQQFEQTPSFQNSNQQPIQFNYHSNQQIHKNPSYKHIQDNQLITGEQDVENISQGNKSFRKQTSQSDVHESQSIKQHQIIQSQDELPLETKELIVEENVKTIDKQTYEINNIQQPKQIKTTEQVNTNQYKNKLQQSNHSENRSPGEQLSMIEVNDDLRSKFN